MNKRNKHIIQTIKRTIRSFLKTSILLAGIIMFISLQSLKAQVISNNTAAISLTPGVVVTSDTVENSGGSIITNNGIISLTGSYNNDGTTSGNGTYNIGGDWTNTNIFNEDASTVQFNGNNIQTITGPAGSETFNNLIINNSGADPVNRIILANNVTVTDTLTMNLGNIDPGVNTLYLSGQFPLSLNYTSGTGSRILGKFERGINALGNYLFPMGTAANYNPLNLNINSTPTSGYVLSEFISADPGSAGLPLHDADVQVYEAYADAYWSLTSIAGFSSLDYNINLDGAGFSNPIAVQDITRIIKRTTAGGDWVLDGTHRDAIGTVAYRDTLSGDISNSGTHFGLGRSRPRIWDHPADTAVCDGTDANFTVVATGRNPLEYQWFENSGSGWDILNSLGIYYGTTTSTLNIYPTDLTMDGYQYRVRVTDAHGNYNFSDFATLTVDSLPIAFATPDLDTICNNTTTLIALTSDVFGTTFEIEVVESRTITGTSTSLIGGNSIQHTLTNPTNTADYVVYRIIPTGPNPTTCAGTADTAIVWVNPTPQVIATILKDTICNNASTYITLTTPTVLTDGIVRFNYTSTTSDAGLIGLSGGTVNHVDGYVIEDLLTNTTAWSAIPQVARYTIIPTALEIGCVNGPAITDSITVHPTADTYFNVDSVTCYLESNGRAGVIAANGINIFTYSWDDPYNHQTATTDSVLSRGLYTVTVTDNQACTKIVSVNVEEPDQLYIVEDSLSHVACFGAGNGYVEVNPIGGNGSYTYWWEPDYLETTVSFIENLDGGDYDLHMEDYKGCARDTVFTVIEPTQANISIDKTNIRCFGENNGSAIVTTPAISYLWDNGATTNSITNLSAGDYIVTITYGTNCKTFGGVEIEEPDLLTSDIITSNIICAGDENGTINITAEGGNFAHPYEYYWQTFDGNGLVDTDEDQSGLSGGNYYVTVSDYRGCEVLDTAFVGEPPVFTSSLNFESVTCYNDGDGWISLDVEGGNGNDYTYLWSNAGGGTFENADSIYDLQADEYYVTILDTSNCEIYDTAIITEPDLLETFISETDISCFGYDDGTAKITITGGNGGYVIDWSNGENSDSIYGLPFDTYYVTVVDSKSCKTTNSVEITQPEKIDLSDITSENITCFEYNNGSIVINPTGGILPYYYNWSHDSGLTGNEATNLSPGSYSISVIDNNNCVEEEDNIVINEPDQMIATITKNDITCYDDGDGYISLSLFGGTPDYTYSWSNGVTDASADMLTDGDYNIKITDRNNCLIDTTVKIIEPEKLIIVPEIRRPTCPDIQDGYVELNITGGRTPYTIYWDNGNSEENLYDIRSGIYDVLINDSSFCEVDTTFIIRSAHNFCFTIPTAFTPNGDSYNEKWVIDMGGLYPNAEVEIFDRRGKRIFFSKGYEESQYWDGTYNGKNLPMDAYYYIINLKNGAERLSGIITIIR